jgi:hypothetical protein
VCGLNVYKLFNDGSSILGLAVIILIFYFIALLESDSRMLNGEGLRNNELKIILKEIVLA